MIYINKQTANDLVTENWLGYSPTKVTLTVSNQNMDEIEIGEFKNNSKSQIFINIFIPINKIEIANLEVMEYNLNWYVNGSFFKSELVSVVNNNKFTYVQKNNKKNIKMKDNE